MCIDAGQHFAVLSQTDEDLFDRRYNIGAWAWELQRFPARWYDRFAYYDEIWVGSSFIASAIAPISPIPVIRIPPVMAPSMEGLVTADRVGWRRRPDEFLFLFMFDVHSHLPRKNPLAIIEAFRRAFRPSEPVRLILKCVNAESDPAGFRTLVDRASGAAIDIHSGYVSAEALRGLMSSCDAYVSLHRSEGIGLTIADAMGLGKPVIATGWSGNTDFMDVSNAFPVGYRLVALEENVGPYHAGEVWAEPSVEHAAELMRFVVDHPDEARARGHAGTRDHAARLLGGADRRADRSAPGHHRRAAPVRRIQARREGAGRGVSGSRARHPGRGRPRRAGGWRRDGGQQGRPEPLAIRRQNRLPLSGDRHGCLRRLSPRRQRCRDRGARSGHRPGAPVPAVSWHVAVVARSLRRVSRASRRALSATVVGSAVRALRRAPAWRAGGASA